MMAMRNVASHGRFWCVVVFGVGLDLWSKHWAFHTLGQNACRTVISGVLELRTTLNPGALFGIGRGQTTLFVIASILALVLVLWMFAQCPARRWFTQIALGAILAGALGNLYDRAFVRLVQLRGADGQIIYCVMSHSADGESIVLRAYPPTDDSLAREIPLADTAESARPVGCVRDFIKIPTRWFGEREAWPWVFNVADMLLVGGVGILAIRLLRDRRARVAPAEAELDAAGEKS